MKVFLYNKALITNPNTEPLNLNQTAPRQINSIFDEKLIPRFIQQLLNNQKVTIQGDGSNVRAFLHVNDVCSALKLILKHGITGEVYNIGSDDHHEYSVKQIAQILINKIQKCETLDGWIEYIEDRPFNDKRYYISNQKVKELGWTIETDFDTGIDELIDLMNNSC
jgi:dTDP-D-glucose 4,6-dehydratase